MSDDEEKKKKKKIERVVTPNTKTKDALYLNPSKTQQTSSTGKNDKEKGKKQDKKQDKKK